MGIEDIQFTRGTAFFDPKEHKGRIVTVVGGGGIGSSTILCLAKMFGPEGPDLNVIDFDVVEGHNIPNQFFAHTQTGLSKVMALAGLAELLGGAPINTYDNRFEEVPPELFSDIVISGLDSMSARKELWDTCIKNNPSVNYYLDGRLTGQYITIYAIKPNDPAYIAYYESSDVMFTDDEAEEAPCTARGIIDVGQGVGAFMGRHVRYAMKELSVPHTFVFNFETLNSYQGTKLESVTAKV